MRTALVLIMLATLTLASAADAARAPTRTERTGIIRATKVYIDMSGCCSIISRIRVEGIRVSTVNRRWAVIHIFGYDESGGGVGPATALVHKGYLTNRWTVREFGSSDLGCEMPVRVQRDLRELCP
ncbi:MAG: hypothetical protein WD249_13015 [Gaiellaceae bacterium]